MNNPDKRPDTMDTSFGLIGTNLAFSCASCLFGLLGFLASFMGIRGCTPKGLGGYNNAVKDILDNKSKLLAPPMQLGTPFKQFQQANNQPAFQTQMPNRFY